MVRKLFADWLKVIASIYAMAFCGWFFFWLIGKALEKGQWIAESGFTALGALLIIILVLLCTGSIFAVIATFIVLAVMYALLWTGSGALLWLSWFFSLAVCWNGLVVVVILAALTAYGLKLEADDAANKQQKAQ